MPLPMSVRASQKLKLSPFDLLTPRVSHPGFCWSIQQLIDTSDANLFKEAFIKAQQENEALFPKQAAS